ncbi:MAG TPA: cation-translocating P-type ATPase [Blastocatellia bacterium]|nr:cation-translocating P-type ATPase [Blastocatellia bacterium]
MIPALHNPHNLGRAEVLEILDVDQASGLDAKEAASRLEQFGPNLLAETGVRSRWQIVWEQISATMVIVLLVAATVSALMGDYKDTIAIVAIVIANTILGFGHEYQAERALAALRTLAVPTVKVRRNGLVGEAPASELVPGDIVLLEAGNLVAADCRVLEAANLRVQEAALTGESAAVQKQPQRLDDDETVLAERTNMVYSGTTISSGRGVGVAVRTGMETEIGAIATMIQEVDREPTPLQRRLDKLGQGLALAALSIVAIVFALGIFRGVEFRLLLLTAISMAVAAVPEGLPAVVTITLALGAKRMLRRHALIRKLPAVETLGSVTVICADKTGTLTQNRMTVTTVVVRQEEFALSKLRLGEPHGDRPRRADPDLTFLMTGLALCNDAVLQQGGELALGDPTEAALAVAAADCGFNKADLERSLVRVGELPFDSSRKRMTTVHTMSASLSALPSASPLSATGLLAFTKGAVDELLPSCSKVLQDGKQEPMNIDQRRRILDCNDQLALDGMRVLGLAFKILEPVLADDTRTATERDLTFVGLVGMVDPPRQEVEQAVKMCKAAGITPVMITGDHPLTARRIARQLGMADGDKRIVTGRELALFSPEELTEKVKDTAIYARVSPEDKLDIVEALQERGEIVAMTGDGVNDAPALKKADIGVSMGVAGTDVAKEASDIVLLDDNFATIVAAVEEGRVIYDNVRKFIKYIVTTNCGEIWVMLFAPFLGMPLPMLPLQILWMNLVTDGPLALALAVEPAERDTMRHPPYNPGRNIVDRAMVRHILWVGALMSAISLSVGYWGWNCSRATWQTILFTTLTLSQVGHVLAIRSHRDSLFRIGLLSNKPLLSAILLTVIVHLAVIYVPVLQSFFKTASLSLPELLLALALSTIVFWSVELEKWIVRRTESVDFPGNQ